MTGQENVTVILNGVQYNGVLVNGFVTVGNRKVTYGTSVSNTGKSIQESIWEQLDDVMDLMMESGRPIFTPKANEPISVADVWNYAESCQQYGRWQGVAEALCLVICWFENPFHPDVESVKGEAVMRWKRRQEMPPSLTSAAEEVPEGAADQKLDLRPDPDAVSSDEGQ